MILWSCYDEILGHDRQDMLHLDPRSVKDLMHAQCVQHKTQCELKSAVQSCSERHVLCWQSPGTGLRPHTLTSPHHSGHLSGYYLLKPERRREIA